MTQALLAGSLLWGYKWNGPQSHLGSWLFWLSRNLDPEKFGSREVWSPHEKAHVSVPQKSIQSEVVIHYCAWYAFLRNRHYVMIFMWGPNFFGSIFLGDQSSMGQNLLRPKFVGDQKSQGSKLDWGPFQLQPLVAHLLNATYLVCTSWCMLNPCCLICLSVLKYSCFLSGFKLLHFFVKPSYLVAE